MNESGLTPTKTFVLRLFYQIIFPIISNKSAISRNIAAAAQYLSLNLKNYAEWFFSKSALFDTNRVHFYV
jgi:hypothetical protein